MVEIFGKTKMSEIVNGTQRVTFRIPAVSERVARARAGINARAKGLSGFSVERIEQVESGGFPGQKIYDITVTSPR